jgi:hypothetical protein
MKHCRGRPATNNFTQAKAALQHNIDDHPNQELIGVDDPGQELRADKAQELDQGANPASHMVGG